MSSSYESIIDYCKKHNIPCFEQVLGKKAIIDLLNKSVSAEHRGVILTEAATSKSLKLEDVDGGGVTIEDLSSVAGTQDDYGTKDIRPKGDRVLVLVIPPSDVSLAGISIPDSAKDRPQFGIIVKTGSKVDEETKEGNKIIYGQWAGIPLTVQGQQYLMMKDSDILAYL